ncbi:GNAT family N-acetyltransferase [Brachybacterium sp. DNPG3]
MDTAASAASAAPADAAGAAGAADSILPGGYRLVRSAPAAQEYIDLRAGAGLSPKTLEQAAGALTASWAWAMIRSTEDDSLAAMGRVIGDGTWYFHIADVATWPRHRRRGLGRAVMEDLIGRIDAAAPPHPYITLMADPPGQSLYRSLGFVDADPTLGMRLPR